MNDAALARYRKSPEWHLARRTGIGGSDANIIMSGDEASILELWRIKRGEIDPPDITTGNIPVLIGLTTEDLNANYFEYVTGKKVHQRGNRYENPNYTNKFASIDGLIRDTERALFEAKHVGGFQSMDDLIEQYYPQLHHNMAIMDCTVAYLSTLIGNYAHAYERIELDPFYLESLMKAEAEFWAAVESGVPPVPFPPEDIVLGDAHKIADLSFSNRFVDAAKTYLETHVAADQFEEAKTTLKACIEADVKIGYGAGVIVKRAKNGSLRITEGTYEEKRKHRKAG